MTRHIIQQADTSEDGRRTAPAASRNTVPLIKALGARLPSTGRVLEVASGTGQHAAAFAAAFPALEWTPSDVDPGQRESIAAWHQSTRLVNLLEPLAVDVATSWPIAQGSVQAVLTVNLFHLIPEVLVRRFFVEARVALSDGGRVIVYGPFRRGTTFVSDGDQAFDASLRARDPAIGYKSVEEVTDVVESAGFTSVARDNMPANNLLLTFATA
ncbi:DUF938 domain-containing protein [Actibacterium sp. 188UL27-1]|uniref:DUF938 domain-containing protein n=1 Tax=Actibacterium sp. 188UL27-1 TaxID=2786961 RepID=UPI00195A1018|nr:DUF938 domain-containing protein [Actibacterium sp. 188UL27-1]MBM7067013.1 DUF938 domain-containing protein [Actibacterium sp. 188UL27-1]